MKTIGILLVTMAASAGSAQITLPAFHSMGNLIARPELYDGLMVATALEPPLGHPLVGNPFFAVQRFRVEDSRAFATGTVVDVYFETVGGSAAHDPPRQGIPVDPSGSVPAGSRVLLVGRVVRGGVLRLPDLDAEDGSDLLTATVPASADPAVLGEAFVLTTEKRLASAPDPKGSLLGSLAAALPGTGDANVRTIATSIAQFHNRDDVPMLGRPDDQFSKLFESTVARETPYRRALVDYALNDLRYWGYGDRFRRDLRLAADDPTAFPDGVPYLSFEENPGTGSNNVLPKDFRHDVPMTQDEVVGLLGHTKNHAIAVVFLKLLTKKPADANVRLLARFLNSPDPRLRHAFVERLAAWGGFSPPLEPKQVRGADGEFHTEYPGLDEAVARWKAKLGTS